MAVRPSGLAKRLMARPGSWFIPVVPATARRMLKKFAR
jgi:hypothetical protein